MTINRLNSLLLFALIATLSSITLTASAGDKGFAYVSNQSNGTLGVIDLGTLEMVAPLDVAAKGPRGIGISSDGAFVVTANKDSDNISIADTTGATTPKLIAIGKNPEFVRVMNGNAYITYEPTPSTGLAGKAEQKDDDAIPGHIAIVDLKTGKVIHDIVGKPETEGVEFTKDGKLMIVTNESDNSITVHDAKTGKLLKNIPVGQYGNRPRGIKNSPDGRIYVTTLEFSDKMLVLDSQFKVIKEVPTGKSPYGISFDRDGKRLFIASNKEKALQVFDAQTFEKIKDIHTGDRCWHFTFTPDDSKILLACGKSNEIVVIDTATLEVIKRIEDKNLPWGLVTYPKSMGSLDRP